MVMIKKQPEKKPKKLTPRRYKRKPNGKAATGRPEWEIDLQRVKEMAKIQCTDKEIAACLGIPFRTFQLYKKQNPAIEATISEGKETGNASVRSMMMRRIIEAQSDKMIIHYSKQYLGHTEKVLHGSDPDHPLPNEKPIPIVAPKDIQEANTQLDDAIKNAAVNKGL